MAEKPLHPDYAEVADSFEMPHEEYAAYLKKDGIDPTKPPKKSKKLVVRFTAKEAEEIRMRGISFEDAGLEKLNNERRNKAKNRLN